MTADFDHLGLREAVALVSELRQTLDARTVEATLVLPGGSLATISAEDAGTFLRITPVAS